MIPHVYAEPRPLCTVADPRITEASGLVASDLEPGILFTHNDSGDAARFFALDIQCRTRGTYVLPGVSPQDWEDIARGPGHVLWLGDIGDNAQQRRSVTVHRVAEPRTTTGTVRLASTAFSLAYPDGAHNAETLLADPFDGRLYVITKSPDGKDFLYAAPLPLSPTGTNTLQKLDPVTIPGFLPLTTAGDISPDGSTLVLRTYREAWELDLPALVKGAPRLAGAYAKGLGTPVQVGFTGQGEAIAYSVDGQSLYTLPEGKGPSLDVLSPTTPTAAPTPPVGIRERTDAQVKIDRGPLYAVGGLVALTLLLLARRRRRPGAPASTSPDPER